MLSETPIVNYKKGDKAFLDGEKVKLEDDSQVAAAMLEQKIRKYKKYRHM